MAPLDPQNIGIYREREQCEIDRYITDEWNGDRSWLYTMPKHESKTARIHRAHCWKIITYIKSIFGKN